MLTSLQLNLTATSLVLEGSEKSLGKDHPSTIDVVFCLAGLYHKQGKLEDAVVMYQRAMTSTTMTLGI